MELCSYLSALPSTAIKNVSLMDCARSPSSPIISLTGFDEKVDILVLSLAVCQLSHIPLSTLQQETS